MILFWTAIGTVSAACAIFTAFAVARVMRSNSAAYETNRAVTGNFFNAAVGRISPLVSSSKTDFRINHFVEPCVTEDGEIIWERAGSLSDEAVDGVFARH